MKVVRTGGSVGAVQVTWLIDSSDDSQQLLGHHEFVPAGGILNFSASQRSANLTVSFINDMLPSLDTRYRLMLTNVSQVTLMLVKLELTHLSSQHCSV